MTLPQLGKRDQKYLEDDMKKSGVNSEMRVGTHQGGSKVHGFNDTKLSKQGTNQSPYGGVVPSTPKSKPGDKESMNRR